jgi:hypothetical protein
MYCTLPVSKPERASQKIHCVAVITEPVWVQQNQLSAYYLSLSLSVLFSRVHCIAVITEPDWVQQNKLTTYYLSVSLSVLVSRSTV